VRALLFALAWASLLAWFFGQVVRDATYAGQLAFYMPSPLVAALLALCALVYRLKGRRRLALAAGLAALVPLAFVLGVEQRFTAAPAAAPPGAETLRIVHWNVRKGRAWDRAVPLAVGAKADLYAFSEPPWGTREREVAAARGFSVPVLRLGEVSLVARGSLGKPEWVSHDVLQAVLVPWVVDGRTWSVLLVDFPSDLRVARDPGLRRLREILDTRRPDLVLGDLNAPRRSAALTPPPQGFVHAYDAAGSGWSATWPMPLPLWSIDHCLVGPRLRVLRYRLQGSSASDHRMQVVDVAAEYHGATFLGLPHAIAAQGRRGHLAGGARHVP
jgi:endonuclease/exonuclease/phosphatase (EEP) superfamily protein YafD